MSIRKRTWQTANGEKSAFVADFKDQAGKRHRKHFQRRKDAVAWWESQGSVAVREGVHVSDRDSITVAEAGELWLRRCATDHDGEPQLERSTLVQYDTHVRLHIVPYLGAEKLTRLNTATVKAFETKLSEEGRSPTMVRKVVTSLGTLIANAQDHGLVGRNVVRDRPRRKRSGRHKHELEVGRDIPTKAELKAMIDHAPDRWRPLVVTAIFTGLRASELRGLMWDCVDLKNGTVRVAKRVDRWGKFGPPKSVAGRRTVPLAPIVLNTLKQWKLQCPPGDLVFPNGAGRVDDTSAIRQRVLGRIQKAAGISDDADRPKYGLHSLRHATASLWIEQGFQPKQIQAMMGHSSITMTFDRYGHLFPSPKSDAEAMAQVQARVLG